MNYFMFSHDNCMWVMQMIWCWLKLMLTKKSSSGKMLIGYLWGKLELLEPWCSKTFGPTCCWSPRKGRCNSLWTMWQWRCTLLGWDRHVGKRDHWLECCWGLVPWPRPCWYGSLLNQKISINSLFILCYVSHNSYTGYNVIRIVCIYIACMF